MRESMEIRKTIEIDASVETVFRALTAEDELTQWFPDRCSLRTKNWWKGKIYFLCKKS